MLEITLLNKYQSQVGQNHILNKKCTLKHENEPDSGPEVLKRGTETSALISVDLFHTSQWIFYRQDLGRDFPGGQFPWWTI